VEVSIDFPDIAAAIAAVPNPNTPTGAAAIVNVSLPAQFPRFSFRAIAVYGASHSYPCTAETFSVMVESMQVDQDVTRDLCSVRLDDKFQVTTLTTGVPAVGGDVFHVTDSGDNLTTDQGDNMIFNP
jgi:hypothetical protein